MSTEPASLTAPTTLDAVINAVLARTDIGLCRRQEMASAVRVMSRLLGQPATDIPADPQLLRGRVAQITAAGAGLRPAPLAQYQVALQRRADDHGGERAGGRRSTAALHPEWRDLLARIPDRYDRAKLSQLARICSLRALTPEQVNDTVLTAFGEMLVRSTVERPKQVYRDACMTWNRMVDRINGWPATRLTVPYQRSHYAMRLEAFPRSFGSDLQAYLDRLAGKDLFADIPHQPATSRFAINASGCWSSHRRWCCRAATSRRLGRSRTSSPSMRRSLR